MVALAIHNWASAAVGIAIAIALVRGFARKNANGIGNFWADVVRCTLSTPTRPIHSRTRPGRLRRRQLERHQPRSDQ
jgi:hypothetical protein